MFYSAYYDSPVGRLFLAGNEKGLSGVWLENQKYFASGMKEDILPNPDYPLLAQTCSWLDEYFAGGNPSVSQLPLAPQGNEFRQIVWRILCDIPLGQICTYGDIAKSVAIQTGKKSMSAQAVGGAVGHNPISIIIPCHRVVGSGGNLTGYAGGLDIKIKLLQHEGVDISQLHRPKKGTAL